MTPSFGSSPLLALTGRDVVACPLFWALVCGALGLWMLIPARLPHGKSVGGVFIALASVLFAYDLPLLGDWTSQGVFWLLALITLGAAVAMIASRSPVYAAIWFALSLLGTAGLFLFQGAQFLGVATIVVYAGAIVVTFLFVIMLAQPEGQAPFDRITWGSLSKVLGIATAGGLVGILAFMMGDLKTAAERPATNAEVATAHQNLHAKDGILADKHMANIGRRLFGEHLVSVELAGTLLLVALVGAVAIAMHGKSRLAERIEEALE